MKSSWIFLILLFLLAACTPAQALMPPVNDGTSAVTVAKITEMVENNSVLDATLTLSETPGVTPTTAPTRTLQPTLRPAYALQATVAAYGIECEFPADYYRAELSPDGNWVAVMCEDRTGEIDNHLRVVNLQGEGDWTIHYSDYAHGTEYQRRNYVFPFHWSQGGKYLYVTSPSIMEGCCWLGHDMFLIRLNLENGQQTEIVNEVKDFPEIHGIDFSFSPSERYLMYIPQEGFYSKLYILDLLTWKARGVELDYERLIAAGDAVMSNYEDKVILMILQRSEDSWDDEEIVRSLVVINLEDGSQKKLVANVPYFEEAYRPVRWEDQDHVLLSRHGDEQWLLNVQTAELKEVIP